MAIVIPSSIYQATPTEKAQLYNSLLGQGYSDEEIRVAAGAPRDDNWSLLQSIAQSLQPVESLLDAGVQDIGIADQDLAQQYEPVIYESYTPPVIEEQPQVIQQPVDAVEPLLAEPLQVTSTQTEAPVASRFSGLFASQDVLADKAQEVLAASGLANDPRFADAIVGSFTQNGINYNVLGDGSMQGVIETPTGAYLSAGFTPTGQQATEELSTQFEQTSTDRLLGTLANAAIAAGTAAGLGPAGVGLMSVPAAAATGAGFTSFANSGDLAQALRAAALAGTTAFGIETLFPGASAASVDPDVAVDVANLAAQGVPEEQIAQILTQEGVANEVINSALDAQFGVSAAGSAKGLEFPAAPSLVEQVPVVSQASQAGLLSTAAPVVAPAATGLLGAQSFPVPSESVQVQTTTAPAETQVSAPVAAATGGLLAPTQTVPVQAATTPSQTQATAPAAAVGGLLTPTQTVPVQATNIPAQTQATSPTAAAVGTLAPTQTVPVESRTIKTETPSILAPAAATVITTPRGEVPVTTYEVPRSSTGPIEGSTTVNPLLALGLLGLAGTALGGGGSTAAPFDQAAYDAIARGRSPVYPRGEFTPISLGGLPGMGGMGEIGAYDYFGPYYGAGRFGARPQAFALPGLLGPQMMSIPTTPSRSAAV
jgi:hypothetical protein